MAKLHSTTSTNTFPVHRCRFVDFVPSAVTALAFPPLTLPLSKGKPPVQQKEALKYSTLAVGHANGNIDLCEWTGTQPNLPAPQAWIVRKVRRSFRLPVRRNLTEAYSRRCPGQYLPKSTLWYSLSDIRSNLNLPASLLVRTSDFSALEAAPSFSSGI